MELGFPHLIFDLSLIIQILEFIIHHIPDKRIKVSISIQQQLDFFYSAINEFIALKFQLLVMSIKSVKLAFYVLLWSACSAGSNQ